MGALEAPLFLKCVRRYEIDTTSWPENTDTDMNLWLSHVEVSRLVHAAGAVDLRSTFLSI